MSDEFVIDWGNSVLIPDGEYQAVYVSHATSNGSYGPKVKITFRIVSLGPHFENLIDAWYNVKGLGTKKGKRGKIILSRHSKLTYELVKLFHRKQRPERLSPEMLKGHIVMIKVRTVTQNSKQKSLPEPLRYSTVDSMVCLMTHQDIKETPLLNPEPIPIPIPTING
ncbi:MAG: hypothetical protein EBZ63_03585 [Burkholderiaceae bacterium]|nr:hypothetical protein [Burkholderiaceae bacterium]